MSAALKPKRVESDEDDEDRIEYIEVKKNSEIKAILRAEQQATRKEDKPAPPAQHTPTPPPPPPAEEKQQKGRKFIKDDREREYPRQKEDNK
jgi:hypothetical protein